MLTHQKLLEALVPIGKKHRACGSVPYSIILAILVATSWVFGHVELCRRGLKPDWTVMSHLPPPWKYGYSVVVGPSRDGQLTPETVFHPLLTLPRMFDVPGNHGRQRASRACDACRTRRVKCSGTSPCTACQAYGEPERCHFRAKARPNRCDQTPILILMVSGPVPKVMQLSVDLQAPSHQRFLHRAHLRVPWPSSRRRQSNGQQRTVSTLR